jgi:hypothetical protein
MRPPIALRVLVLLPVLIARHRARLEQFLATAALAPFLEWTDGESG